MAGNYRSVFMGLPSRLSGEFKVELLDEVAKNPDGTNLGLLKCLYTLGPVTSQNMVKEGSLDHPISEAQFVFLATLNRHPNALVIENYYPGENKSGCLVVQSVNGTFQSWLNHEAKNNRLFTNDGRMTSRLRTVIISLCSFVDNVLAKGWYPQHLTMDDLFIKMQNGEPTLKVLLSDVRKRTIATVSTWNHVKDITNQCCTANQVALSVDTSSFCNFIGRQTKQVPLEKYPDPWTDVDKIAYLRLIIHAEINSMKNSVKDSGIDWPVEHGGAIQPILRLIMGHDKKTTYNTSIPRDYVRLARNVTKDFDVPSSVKTMVKDTTGFLRKMEEWTPTIWTDLYEIIGPLGMK